MRLAMYTAENGYCERDDAGKEELRELIDIGAETAKDFFDEMSKKYENDTNVIYEICNEPNGNVSWADIKSYAEQIIPIIRANAPEAVILLGTPTWSQEVDKAAADPLEEENVLYTLHFYAAIHK